MKTKYFLFLAIALSLGFTACRKVLCANIDCGHGVCTGTRCECEDGWAEDENGRCLQAIGCTATDCGHGNCNGLSCECDPGWQLGTDLTCSEAIPCYNVDCGHGSCDPFDGGCNCDPYYVVGADNKCSLTYAQQVAGTWRGTHQVTFGGLVGPYDMVISADSLSTHDLHISNYGNETCTTTGGPLIITASMITAGSVYVQNALCTGASASGSLTLQGLNQMTVSGHITYNSNSYSFDGVFDRQ